MQQNSLRPRRVEERFFLSDVEPGRNATSVARFHQIQALLQGLHGAVQNRDFRVQLPQGEVVGGEFRGQHQADIFEIGGVGLIGGLRGFDGAAALAEEVHFIAHGKGKVVVTLRDCTSNRSR